MTVIKQKNAVGGWDPILVGIKGDTGPSGGPVPAGGTVGQQIVKTSSTDFAVAWQTKPEFDVRDYGVAGNGITDDTVALKAAHDAAVTRGGGTVLIGGGLTVLTDKLAISGNVPMRFVGDGKVVLRSTGSALFEVNNATAHVVFDGLRLDGAGIALTNDGSGIIRILGASTTVMPEVVRCDITNGKHGVVVATGAGAFVHHNFIHDLTGNGVFVQTTGATLVDNNDIRRVGQNGVSVRPVLSPVALAFVQAAVTNNNITDIRDDWALNGPYGNGIVMYYAAGVAVTGNVIRRCAFSFIRGNRSAYLTVTANTGNTNSDDSGIQIEFGCTYVTVTANTLDNVAESGICMTNIEDGSVGQVCNDNIIRNFGVIPGTSPCAGILLQIGQASGNHIDGMGAAGATYGVRLGTPTGVTYEYRCLVVGNQIAGVKYPLGMGISSTTGTKESWIVGNQVTRRDANYVAPIGGVGSANSDAGGATTITAAAALTAYWANNNFDFPTAQTPQPFMAGSRVKINGVWSRSDGARWIADVVAPTVPVAATDPATTMALVNALRDALVVNGSVK